VAESDDLLSAEEIEALIQASRGEAADAGATSPSTPSGGQELLGASEIEALMQGAAPRANSASSAEATLQKAENQLAAALASDVPKGIPPELGVPAPFSFPELTSVANKPLEAFPLSALQDVELDLRIELGRTELLIDEVLKLREGSVVPLDKLAGDPVDILVNGRLVARGEVLVLNDNFCVRVAEILTPEG
jgi:flagellar motor switch protein FliN/FliY